ncbi:MAG: class I SAM-dependent rRNA methyltransferase [Alphaproteobacteria bacterium]|nr:class I SAM-dependent rRNA methyltransferase [Alphaproteobacteria bacterium]
MSERDGPPAATDSDVYVLPGRDRRVASGHPWVYSNEVRLDAAAKALPAGSVVRLRRTDGKPLGIGTFNPNCLITFRLFSTHRDRVDRAFLAERIGGALALRERLFDAPFYRLVHGEADGLPGLVIDRFGDIAVVQTATAGMDRLLDDVLAALDEVLAPRAVVVRNAGSFRRIEELPSYVRVAKGAIDGPIEVPEHGRVFLVDVVGGQKTGWYFDQRPGRALCAPLGRGGTVLDLYCHTGAFGIAATAEGATQTTGIDSSEPAIALARRTAERNGVAERCTFEQGDVTTALERLGAEGRRFRLVIADPPPFARSRKEVVTALRGYRKLTRLAAAVVEPGGYFFIAACSHNVMPDMLLEEVAAGLHRAERFGRILATCGAGPDHPIHPWLPESRYLCGMLLQIDRY